MTIKELYDRFEISLRAYNVCETLGLKTIGDLNDFLKLHRGFKSARNCGDKTNKELSEIISQYNNLNLNDSRDTTIQNFKSEKDKSVFDIYLNNQFDKLSVRAKNALLSYFNNSRPTFEAVKTEFLLDSFNAINLQNVGSLTSNEIAGFKRAVKGFYSLIQNNSISVLEQEKIILNSIVGFNCNDEFYIVNFSIRNFPLLSFIKKYSAEVFNLSKIDEFILKNSLCLLDRKHTLENIAKTFNLTRERIRQKSIAVFEDVDTRSKDLRKLIPYCNYTSIQRRSFIALQELGEPESIRSEIHDVGPVFASYFLGLFLKDNFYCFSPLNKFRRPDSISLVHKYEEVKSIKGSYLINQQVYPKEELIDLYNVLICKFCERRNEDQIININALASHNISPEKLPIITALVNSEFRITITDGNIILPRNTSKLVFEYAIEALEKINRPAHISEILKEVVKLHPEYNSDESALRGSMGRHKSIFIYFGRSSTYGLKNWETKKKNIKGGTIKNIIEEYLSNESEPKHITEIMNHLGRFRDTTYNSVISNLKLDNKSKFKFYGGGYVGLTRKTYSNTAFGIEFKNAGEIDWEKIANFVF